MKEEFNIVLNNIDETRIFARNISKFLKSPMIICLYGEVGTGKTTFCRFLINSLSKKKIKVLSPTFPILQVYNLEKLKIWHYDFYRLKNKDEILSLDFDIATNDCVLIEWPQLLEDLIPKDRIDINFLDGKCLISRNIKIHFNGRFKKIKDKICTQLKKK
ncbi:MAG: tRNA (adenosine(37)-N6)-threonylcarbamoyltransferase complex ATPase subunit type 1 TsaE [Rickettsiales bacterium]|nr:tRNA (adenosine(37)-N6)-threonylcarbamoyltransferase complex ATPase subunit type 1 TsaE [Rickettsiales bacterium]